MTTFKKLPTQQPKANVYIIQNQSGKTIMHPCVKDLSDCTKITGNDNHRVPKKTLDSRHKTQNTCNQLFTCNILVLLCVKYSSLITFRVYLEKFNNKAKSYS